MVIRQNHIGDIGKPIAQVMAGLHLHGIITAKQLIRRHKELDLTAMYRKGIIRPATTGLILDSLQNKKTESTYYPLWRALVGLQIVQLQKIYDLLNITLEYEDIRGESFYHGLPMFSRQELEVYELFDEMQTFAVKLNPDIMVTNDREWMLYDREYEEQIGPSYRTFAEAELALRKWREENE
jgi:arginyl-tRNA synthetase